MPPSLSRVVLDGGDVLQFEAGGGGPEACSRALPRCYRRSFQDDIFQRDILHVLDALIFGEGADVHLLSAVPHVSTGEGEVVPLKLPNERVDINPVGLDPVLMELDLDVLLIRAPDLHVGYAVYALERTLDVALDEVIDIVGLLLHSDRRPDDRIVVVAPFSDIRALHVVRQFGHDPIEPVPHLEVRHVHVRIGLKSHGDPAPPVLAVGPHVLDAPDRAQGLLHGLGDPVLHLPGIRVAIGYPYAHPGVLVPGGKQFQGDLAVRDVPHHEKRNKPHDHGYGPVDGEVGKECGFFGHG